MKREILQDILIPEGRLASYAVASVNWSKHSKSYLDAFSGFLLAVIAENNLTATGQTDLPRLLNEHFSMDFPPQIVRQIVQRCRADGTVKSVEGEAFQLTDKGRRQVSKFRKNREEYASKQKVLVETFVDWIRDQHRLTLSESQAIALLDCCIAGNGKTSIRTLLEEVSAANALDMKDNQVSILAATFIAEMGNRPEISMALNEMARGMMMVKALFSPTNTKVDLTATFRDTTLFLDTKIVLRALGYEDEIAKKATVSAIEMFQKQGATIGIFEFTLNEIKAIFDFTASKAKAGTLWSSRPGSVEAYFFDQRASDSMIMLHSHRLEDEIRHLNIEIKAIDSYKDPRYVVDESGLEDFFKENRPNYKQSALLHDLKVFSAIEQLRRNRARNTFESSKATFITLNNLMVRAGRHLVESGNNSWPLVMNESDAVSLAWVKEPSRAPDLPLLDLQALSLASTNPSEEDWEAYVQVINELRSKGEISDHDVIVIRKECETNRIRISQNIFSVSGENVSEVDGVRSNEAIHKDVNKLLEEARESYEGPLREENAQNTAELKRNEEELLHAKSVKEEQIRLIQELESDLKAMKDQKSKDEVRA